MANSEAWKAWRHKAGIRMRLQLIEMLGGKCIKCGMADVRVLQINHLHGNRREAESGKKEFVRTGTMTFYWDVLKGRRKTDDLDLRCANCNILYEFETGRRQEYDLGYVRGPYTPSKKPYIDGRGRRGGD